MPTTLAECSAARPEPTEAGTAAHVGPCAAQNAMDLRSARARRLGAPDDALVGRGSALPEHTRLRILAMASAPSLDHAQGTLSMRQP